MFASQGMAFPFAGMVVYHHGWGALLYVVPALLAFIVGTAYFRGEAGPILELLQRGKPTPAATPAPAAPAAEAAKSRQTKKTK